MNPTQIKEQAQALAHENTAACRNRPDHMQSGHSPACKRLANVIANAMLDVQDHAGAEAARLREELERMQAMRNMEGDRLDWLLGKLPSETIQALVGAPKDDLDPAQWRQMIDKVGQLQAKDGRQA